MQCSSGVACPKTDSRTVWKLDLILGDDMSVLTILLVAIIVIAALILSKKSQSKTLLVRRLMIALSIGIAISGIMSAVSTWTNTMNGVETNPMNAASELEQLMVLFFAPGAAMISFFLALMTFVVHLIFIGVLWLIYFIIKRSRRAQE